MSRKSSAEIVENPTLRRVEWKSSKQCFKYYNKDTKEDVEVALPLKFIVLDESQSITGFHKRDKREKGSGVYSNEVHSDPSKKTSSAFIPMVVRRFDDKSIIAEGLYKDIKDQISNMNGVKFQKNIYALVLNSENNTWESWCINLYGSGFEGWMEFVNKKPRNFIYKDGIVVDGFEPKKNSGVDYAVPTFSKFQLTKEEEELAIKATDELENYWHYKFSTKEEVEESAPF